MPTRIDFLQCNKQRNGTALIPCAIRKKRTKSVFFVTPDWSFDLTDANLTFNDAYIREQIMKGTFTPFLNTLSVTDNTPETTTKDYADGAIGVIRNGLPQITLEFDNGVNWHANAYGYNSFNAGGVIEIDVDGTIWAYRNVAKTRLVAMAVNMFNTATERQATGDETPATMISYQISDEVAYNTLRTAITAQEAGININSEIKGIADVTITPVTTTAANFVVDVTYAGNNGYPVQALSVADFQVINNATGAVVNITQVAPVAGTPGRYKITGVTGGTTVRVRTFDEETGTDVALIMDIQMYRGESEPITITA